MAKELSAKQISRISLIAYLIIFDYQAGKRWHQQKIEPLIEQQEKVEIQAEVQ